MTKSLDKQLECETIIRWDETGKSAQLWTASPAVRREWESYEFPVQEIYGRWYASVPVDRISYRMVKKVR